MSTPRYFFSCTSRDPLTPVIVRFLKIKILGSTKSLTRKWIEKRSDYAKRRFLKQKPARHLPAKKEVRTENCCVGISC